MGLDRRNWRKPYTEDELKSMLAAGEMLQLRQRVQELEKERADLMQSIHDQADRYDELSQELELSDALQRDKVAKLTAERDELLAAMIHIQQVACSSSPELGIATNAIASVKEK